MKNVHDLVEWFQKKYPQLVVEMKNSDHHYNYGRNDQSLNPYHLEGSVFCHTLLVLKVMEIRNRGKDFNSMLNLYLAALLHDVAKPDVRMEKHKDRKVSFYNHEPLSALLSVDFVHDFIQDFPLLLGYINLRRIFELIALHTEVFKLDSKEINKRMINNPQLAQDLEELSYADRHGRFFHVGGEEIKIESLVRQFKEKYDNHITLMVGLPGSGKSHLLKNRDDVDNYVLGEVVSRDDMVMSQFNNEKTYDEAFKLADHKKIDKDLDNKIRQLVKEKKNFTVDMTNLSRKSRRNKLGIVAKHNYMKTAIVVLPNLADWVDRLEERKKEGKTISEEVMERMASSFYPPLFDEFDEIEYRIGL